MGEKETSTGLAEDPAQAAKAAGPRKDEQERWVQDDTPDGETAKSYGKASPKLMERAVGGGQVDPTPAERGAQVGAPKKSFAQRTGEADDGIDDAGDSPSDERGMNSIRNLKA